MSKRDPLAGVTPPPKPLSYDEQVRKRQRSRAVVMGLALAAFAVLLYAVTIAKIGSL